MLRIECEEETQHAAHICLPEMTLRMRQRFAHAGETIVSHATSIYFVAANGVDVHSRKEEECKSANLEAVTWKFRLSGSAAWE
jgi:hypothetical protein